MSDNPGLCNKLVWVDADERTWGEAKEKVTAALESCANAVLVAPENIDRARELGRITVASAGGHPDIVVVGIRSEGDGTLSLPEEARGFGGHCPCEEAQGGRRRRRGVRQAGR